MTARDHEPPAPAPAPAPTRTPPPAPPPPPHAERQVALVDLLDRMLTGGVVLTGDLVLSITDIDLVKISLRAVVVAAEADSPWALTSLGAPDAGEDLEVRRRDPA